MICRIILLGLLLLCFSCSDNENTPNGNGLLYDFVPIEKELNVIVVSFDALRADSLGVYNPESKVTPEIDFFSSNALVFDQAHSAAQATPTSFAAAFTGKLPSRSFLKWKLIKGQTLASVFKHNGYVTSFVTGNVQINRERNFDQGFDHFEIVESSRDEDMIRGVLELIKKNKNEKFFSWFHFLSPHTPYLYREMAEQFYDADYNGRYKMSVPAKYTLQSPEEITFVKQLYDGQVFYADHIFDLILKRIQEEGLADNTIIILTSDHGEEFLEHKGLEHDSLFEEIIKIPFIVKHPHALKKGRVTLPFSNVDLLPTLASILGLQYDDSLDGIDLGRGNLDDRVKASVAMTKGEKIEVAILLNGAKLIRSCTPIKKALTFDLQKDPLELVDLGEKHKLTGQLNVRLHELFGDDPCKLIESSIQGVSPENGLTGNQIKKLKSLGYLK